MIEKTGDGKIRPHQLPRRHVIRATAAGTLLGFGASSIPAKTETSGPVEPEQTYELHSNTTGWDGQAPSEIEGETNPTLTLEAGQRYEVAWTNVDGFGHTFTIEDAEGNSLVGPTNYVDTAGTTQFVRFTATEAMTEYFCSIHSQSMRGRIDIRGRPDETTDPDPTETFDSRPLSVRDLVSPSYEQLHATRKQRALTALLSDPEVHDIATGMVSSVAAYDPYTGDVDAISIHGGQSVEIDGGIDERVFEVTVTEMQVAYGLVSRLTDELVGLTITDPTDVSWTAWEPDRGNESRLRHLIRDSRVQEYIGDDDWYPLITGTEAITSAAGIEHGGVSQLVLIVNSGDGLSAVTASIDVRDSNSGGREGGETDHDDTDSRVPDVGEIFDVHQVEQLEARSPHRLATDIDPASETVLGTVPPVSFEQRPWHTANDGAHRIEPPEQSIDRSNWHLEWESSAYHGIELTATYQNSPVFESLKSPVTYRGYDLPERDDRSTLEWLFPEETPVFSGELLYWDVHSPDGGGPGPQGIITYPETDTQPDGFRIRTHYYSDTDTGGIQASNAGHSIGKASYEISYDFWEDGSVMPVWRRRGGESLTTYSQKKSGETSDSNDDRIPRHCIATVAMDVIPGRIGGVEIHRFDGNEWTVPDEEFYQIGKPGSIVRFTNPDGPKTIDLLLDHGMEVVVVKRGPREIPTHQRIEHQAIESSFYHPAQYIGGESIQGERVIGWLLLEVPMVHASATAGIATSVTHGRIRLSGY